MKAFLWLTLVAALFLAGLATDYGYLFRLSYLLAGVLALGLAWSRLNLWGVGVMADKRVHRTRVGTPLEESLTIANRSPLPKVALEVIEESSLPGHSLSRVVSLAPWSESRIVLRTICHQRGAYTLGPTWIAGRDPFGLFHSRRIVRGTSSLVVHPQVFHLSGFLSPSSELSGEGRFTRRIPYVTPKAMSIRDYYPGDSLNRIHWPNTVRWQKLMVKEFEVDPAHDAWVLLDMEGAVQRGRGPQSTEEYGVSIAASLAQRFLGLDLSLGLVVHGEPEVTLATDRGSRQLLRALDALATVTARGRVPLAEAISRQERRLGRHDLLVVVTPSPREDWVGALQLLAQGGVKVTAVLLDAGSFGGGEDSLLVLSTLLASRIPTYLVKKGDRLDQALSQEGRPG